MRQTVAILGTPVDILDMDQTLARLEQFIQERHFHQVATANTDFLVNSMSDPELLHILRSADLVVPDGMPLVWASRKMGTPLPERVTGADMVPRLACLAAQKGYRIYMLGGRPEVAQTAKARLEADYPGIQIVGCVSPPPTSIIEMDGEALLRDIERAAPDILLVAFGNPKQEKWIHMYRERLRNVPVCMGVGGTFDFIAGEVPRASAVLQRSGFEWVHRLAHNPRYLWKRYGRDLTEGGRYLWRQWRALKQQRSTGQFGMCVTGANDCAILSLKGDFKSAALPQFDTLTRELLNEGAFVVLDMQEVVSLDAAALGTLIYLQKHALDCGREICLVSVPPRLANVLRQCQIEKEFMPVSSSAAQALIDRHHSGLYWRVQCGQEAAVITINGTSTQETTTHIERVCQCLLEEGKQVDIDVRGVSYVDSSLLSVFYRLQRLYKNGKAIRFRLVAGSTLVKALTKEKLLDRFTLCDSPRIPHDAKDLPPYLAEANRMPRSGSADAAPLDSVRSFASISAS
jgi:N-acetylglucosaminyldiphosphoundecaprenol N-acetyl-beta-D-mannosaminyltransferase